MCLAKCNKDRSKSTKSLRRTRTLMSTRARFTAVGMTILEVMGFSPERLHLHQEFPRLPHDGMLHLFEFVLHLVQPVHQALEVL